MRRLKKKPEPKKTNSYTAKENPKIIYGFCDLKTESNSYVILKRWVFLKSPPPEVGLFSQDSFFYQSLSQRNCCKKTAQIPKMTLITVFHPSLHPPPAIFLLRVEEEMMMERERRQPRTEITA
eukprot:TRINITY_DN15757_c0_g1_i1.p1 TRINITY_DN15757_c0_g1~~TRINITY_DN15757_c0_g1_i1.p1  ORF type:complete len:123 (+),score=20.46 TRINITY_DN15757_c0_g1_i1:339-707(+)